MDFKRQCIRFGSIIGAVFECLASRFPSIYSLCNFKPYTNLCDYSLGPATSLVYCRFYLHPRTLLPQGSRGLQALSQAWTWRTRRRPCTILPSTVLRCRDRTRTLRPLCPTWDQLYLVRPASEVEEPPLKRRKLYEIVKEFPELISQALMNFRV